MDTGKLLLRQLGYSEKMARTAEQFAQVQWWRERVAELRKQQPTAAVEADPIEQTPGQRQAVA